MAAMIAMTAIAESSATAIVASKPLSGRTFPGSSAKVAGDISSDSYKF